MKRFAIELLALGSLVLVASCGGGGSGAGNASCREILNRFTECSVWEGGNTNCHAEPERDFDDCFAACLEVSSCEDVVEYACELETNSCMDDCLDTEFECDNGELVDPLFQCDGFPDCVDASDEDGCTPTIFRCDDFNGPEVPGGAVCNGEADCQNGSDEEDCGDYLCAIAVADQSALPYVAAAAE